MGQPSFQASNAIVYVTYGAFLILGTGLAWRMRKQPKADFLAANRTQKAMPLALNFIAAAMGSGILFSYPQLATLAGLQGVIVYAISTALPLLVFAALAPIIRRRCPEGFVLTEWTRQRYGVATAWYLGALTLLTLFLYMVAELSAIGQVINALTGLDPLPVIIVECVVTTVYTSLGGFKISFITDNVQGAMICCLVVVATITVGVKTEIKPELVASTGLLDASLVGWQLIYILPVAILTNNFFLANFWLRAFASRTDRDLWLGVSAATAVILVVLTLVGCTGLIAAWSGAWPGDDPAGADADGSVAFFLLLGQLPDWVVGLVVVMAVALSTAAFDSLQSAMVSSASNDVFRNRLDVRWVRLAVVLVIVPTVVLALRESSILDIYLISDLLSAATIPALLVGLARRPGFPCAWWRGFEVLAGGLGGILSVFIFGACYYGSARRGAALLVLEEGLYTGDWAAFGAFVVAPVGSLVWGLLALAARLAFQYARARARGERFDALDLPPLAPADDELADNNNDYDAVTTPGVESHHELAGSKAAGKFF
ncbi:hypothetical protein GGR56DRAFT_641233 [Xylariaceae sp. FL0804]|nr:hypothetical protein GGR56DRAFT_641233 [Xylariaceae sp. FL0804]